MVDDSLVKLKVLSNIFYYFISCSYAMSAISFLGADTPSYSRFSSENSFLHMIYFKFSAVNVP